MIDDTVSAKFQTDLSNPITVHSQKGMKAIGKLIRIWTLDPSERPKPIRQNGRSYTISSTDFVNALKNLGVAEGVEYELRDNVGEIELIDRDPNVLSFLMPEPDVLADIGNSPSDVRMPIVYGQNFEQLPDAHPVPDGQDASHKLYTVNAKDPYYYFVDGFLAAYSCTQCK